MQNCQNTGPITIYLAVFGNAIIVCVGGACMRVHVSEKSVLMLTIVADSRLSLVTSDVVVERTLEMCIIHDLNSIVRQQMLTSVIA